MRINQKTGTARLLAMLLGLCLLISVMGGAALAVDVERTNTVTVNATGEESTDFAEDLADAGLVVDIYQVGAVTAMEGYDSIEYNLIPPYDGIELPETDDTDAWQELAQSAAQIALGDQGQPIRTAAPVGESIELGAGLYLLLARGEDLTEKADYVVHTSDETSADKLATRAYTTLYDYSFAPVLLTLPTKAAVDGVYRTDTPGDWQYDGLTVNLKPERDLRVGSFRIVKTLLTYEGTEPVSFVFTWAASLAGEVVQSGVESLVFTAPGERSVLVENIPVGAYVTVEEAYANGYSQVSVSELPLTVSAEEIAAVTFVNDYDKVEVHGHSIVNTFVSDGYDNGNWTWIQVSDTGE